MANQAQAYLREVPQMPLQPQPKRLVTAARPQHNYLLRALTPEVRCRLFPYLEPVHLQLRDIVFVSGRPISHVYFPTDSVVLMQYLTEDGAPTAVHMVGNEGLLGLSLLMGAESTPGESMVQISGSAYRLPRKRVEEEFNRHGQFLELVLRYSQTLLTQASQTAVCNRLHTIDQQLCRWLLHSIDRQSHNHLMMTQEFIANMLGVRRESISHAANKLQAEGVISYTRGMMTVLDSHKLESLSCECYHVVKKDMDRLLTYLPQHNHNTDSRQESSLVATEH
jgi:CRP-like cAMP-binding protein